MATVTRRAEARWLGRLVEGSGTVSVASGGFPVQTYTLGGRGSDDSDLTSPEELIAAAHASCLAMAVSAALSGMGAEAPEIKVDAACAEGPVGDAYRIVSMALTVAVRATDLDEGAIRAAVAAAAADCPVSALMRGNVEVSLDVVVLG